MFSCELCEFVCSKEGYLKIHVHRIHEKQFRCTASRNIDAYRCDFVGRKKRELEEHLTISHKEELFNCSVCNYTSARKADLRRHTERVHKKITNFECTECNYKTYEKRDLALHINSFHKKEFKLKCKLCDFSCQNFSHLRNHQKTHQPILHCALCDYECKYPSFLQIHSMKEHKKSSAPSVTLLHLRKRT
jgi:KRAB domain-containing zinc finger protein